MSDFTFDASRYPLKPGCYLMKDTAGKVIYVGKTKCLRRRLCSYFRAGKKDWKTQRLVTRIADIEIILVNNETESLVLENNLIKHYRPRFNRMLMRDDTGYSYIVLTDEALPRFVAFKKHWVNKALGTADPNKRFGPYPSRAFRDVLLDIVSDHFQLRTCHPLPRYVCLRYHLGTCGGICEGHVSEDAYHEAVKRAVSFLQHPQDAMMREMKQDIQACADALKFERAQRIKEQLQALQAASEPQIVERDVAYDQAVLYFGTHHVLEMRLHKGALLHVRLFALKSKPDPEAARKHFLHARYAQDSPKELIVNTLDAPDAVAKTLRESNGYKVRITVPQRGVKRKLLKLCELNYTYRVKSQ